ncbi:unnamed protein product [Didymodactylos carnosus]|uniref:Large ribosomal subunit protein eL38 n=1 Tax=Didymodactylos carnosus TaxID=1234261 RepID=A0A813SRK2_9BILA|nr:unnamed protein product [Didymodactylos carnosus]CAF0803694.1 unnamed protein product [Didymodactylos carnosus]CAF3506292.1 unnamed protein product [Didymodactylos carnosus]CAF3588984.1 unnamed protein product [Didymodactylos carnosus]
MPKEIKDIKDFLIFARRKDAKSVTIKRNPEHGTRSGNTKFKIRCSRYLYTLIVSDKEKAEKVKQSLPPGLNMNLLIVSCPMMKLSNVCGLFEDQIGKFDGYLSLRTQFEFFKVDRFTRSLKNENIVNIHTRLSTVISVGVFLVPFVNLYLLDTVTGSVKLDHTHKRIKTPVYVILAENWILVLHVLNETVNVALFEGLTQYNFSSFLSFDPILPIAEANAYILSYDLFYTHVFLSHLFDQLKDGFGFMFIGRGKQ